MTFDECVQECAKHRDLLEQFDRLNGGKTNMSEIGRIAPINQMVDDATGRTSDSIRQFVAFVYEFIWIPLAREKKEAQS